MRQVPASSPGIVESNNGEYKKKLTEIEVDVAGKLRRNKKVNDFDTAV